LRRAIIFLLAVGLNGLGPVQPLSAAEPRRTEVGSAELHAQLFDAVVDYIGKMFWNEQGLREVDWSGRARQVPP
jgi:hypothetical protein